MVTWDDFNKIWASTSPLTPYEFSDPNYSQGWNFVGSTPPARQMWDSIQKQNDEKFKYLRDNFGTPNIVTSSSQMTDTEKVYVYMGSEAGWNNGHWYYYDEGTSSWADGGVYNSVAFLTDTTLSIAGQPADAKAVGDALALKADIAGCTFTGNVSVNADFSVTGDSSFDDVSISGTAIGVTPTAGDNTTKLATTEYVQTELNDYLPLAGGTVTGNLSVNGTSTLTGNVSAGADVVAVGDVSSANIIASNNANIGGNATVTGSVASASLTTTADGTIGGNLSVSGTTTLTGDAVASADLSVAGDSALTKLSVSGTTALAGTSTAPTPSADDNSTKIATTEYVQTEIKPIETDVTINDKRITNIEKLLQGNLYDYQTDSTSAYTKSVPSGAMPYAGLESLGGKTVVMNQLVDSGTTTVSTISGHKYYTLIDGTASIVTADGTAISIVDDTADMVCDLTLMFGSGNEPSTTAEFTAIFGATHYPYNAGTLLSAGVTEVVSKDSNDATLQTISIPTAIRNLEGYGWGIFHYNSSAPYYAYNYIDFEQKKFVKHVASVQVTSADVPAADSGYIGTVPLNSSWGVYAGTTCVWIRNFKGIYQSIASSGYAGLTEKFYCSINNRGLSSSQYRTVFYGVPDRDTLISLIGDGLTMYYELETPVETDISEYLTDDNLISVENGGTLTFPNSNGDDYQIPVPSEETYMIDLQASL